MHCSSSLLYMGSGLDGVHGANSGALCSENVVENKGVVNNGQ